MSRWRRSSADSGPGGRSISARRISSSASKRGASSGGTVIAVHDPPEKSQRRAPVSHSSSKRTTTPLTPSASLNWCTCPLGMSVSVRGPKSTGSPSIRCRP